MKHAVPAYLEWWRAYLALSQGCSQLMLKSMQQMLDAGMAAWIYRPSMQQARLPMAAGGVWMWPMTLAAYNAPRAMNLANATSAGRERRSDNAPEMQQVMAQVIRLVAAPRQ